MKQNEWISTFHLTGGGLSLSTVNTILLYRIRVRVRVSVRVKFSIT